MRRRPLREPRTAAEERRADQHIRRETERIQATWTARERRKRAGLPPEPPPWTFPTIDGRLLGLDE